jgi:hypothetical protein
VAEQYYNETYGDDKWIIGNLHYKWRRRSWRHKF